MENKIATEPNKKHPVSKLRFPLKKHQMTNFRLLMTSLI